MAKQGCGARAQPLGYGKDCFGDGTTDTEQAARAITGRPIPQLLARASSITLSHLGGTVAPERSGDPLSRDAWSGLMGASANPHDYRYVITENARGNGNFELALRGVFHRQGITLQSLLNGTARPTLSCQFGTMFTASCRSAGLADEAPANARPRLILYSNATPSESDSK